MKKFYLKGWHIRISGNIKEFEKLKRFIDKIMGGWFINIFQVI